MRNDEYSTMTEIGAEYGLTSHDMGRYLEQRGFRSDGKPTAKAFEAEFVRQRCYPSGHYSWTWHRAKTQAFLELLGRTRRAPIRLDRELFLVTPLVFD